MPTNLGSDIPAAENPAARQALTALTQALKDDDPDIRKAAALALGKIQEQDRRE